MILILRRALPVLLGVCGVLGFFGHLASPAKVLAVRDLPIFHLPLRTAFARLARSDAPLWNPWIHGGQPILSNPNYAAFYPPSWLALALPPHQAINLLILLHAGLAFAGAWCLARHLDLGRPARALAALAFVGGGVFVSSPNTLNLFCGLAWMPWVLLWGDGAFRAERHQSWLRGASLAAGGLALQLLAGEPVIVMVTALALACLAVDAIVAGRFGQNPSPVDKPGVTVRATAIRLALIAGLSSMFAAIQLIPTLARLAGTARLAGLAAERSSVWSTPPARLAEWLLPTLYGNPMLEEAHLYFGYGLHDQDYPYIISIYCGQAVLVLALAGLLRWPLRRRIAWFAMIGLGVVLALGRHSPLYSGLLADLPPFNLLRYPEKFLILANTGIAFAAATAWDHLLERRRSGHPKTVDQALALALVVAGICAIFSALLYARPDAAEWLMNAHSPLARSPEIQAAGLAYLRGQAVTALVIALATSALLAGHRIPRLPGRALVLGLLAVAAADLWLNARTLHPMAPASEVLEPPPVVGSLPGGPGRIFTDHGLHQGSTEILLLDPSRATPSRLRAALDRLDPYTGSLWGLSYALHEDFDVMLTGWARHGLDAFGETLDRHGMAGTPTLRLMGDWGVGSLLIRRPFEQVAHDWGRGDLRPARVHVVTNPERQPLLRTLSAVAFHETAGDALAAASAAGFASETGNWCVGAAGGDHITRGAAPSPPTETPVLLSANIAATRIVVDYAAATGGFIEVAMTWDAGWSATVAGRPAMIHPTAIGQMGIELPPGDGRIELEYRDPWVAAGAGLSLLGLLTAAVFLHRDRRAIT